MNEKYVVKIKNEYSFEEIQIYTSNSNQNGV